MIGASDEHPDGRVDERDTMFARANRRPGTPPYEDYYRRHPELQKRDDRIRARPGLLDEGTRLYDPVISSEARQWFRRIDQYQPEPSVVARWAERLRDAERAAPVLRELALELGAVAVGCAPVAPEFVYSHRGRRDESYGEPIEHTQPHAVVFLVEMEHGEMRRAPHPEVVRESGRQYFRAAHISMTLAAVLQACGHQTRSQHDAHYDVILPPLAVRAGLGELGRHNILIADRHGTRVRIGAVTTDLPLEHDRPRPLGAFRFCAMCKKCADNCPSRALSSEDPVPLNGVTRWPTQVERCYGYWRSTGSDCGICMACCPFSHRDTPLHRVVRWMVRRLPWLDGFLLWCDDKVYGRDWEPRR